MIILFDKDETEFTTLGIGVLSDASSCVVTEELNGAFELEMEYPVNGAHYKDLDYKRLILAKPNDIMQAQPFRIYKITRPINGTVTVYAQHISYDLTKVPIKALNAEKFSDLCYKEDSEGHIIQNGAIKENQMIETPFRFIQGEDKGEVNTSFKTKWPISFRSLLAGSQDSILDTYTGDYEFDRYKVILHNRRGKDRDFVIRYSKNMTDLEHEVSSELIFNGVCPYYNSTTSETKQIIGKKYREAYISKQAQSGESQPIVYTDSSYGTPIEITIYPANYIAYKDGQDGMDAILTTSVTNIINTENTDSIKLYEHLIHARNIKLTESDKEAPYIFDVTYKMVYINKDSQNEFGSDWLVNSEGTVITHQTWDPSMNPYGPNAPIYRIFTPGAFLYKVFIWDEIKNMYREIESSDKIEEYGPLLPNVGTETEEKDNVILYEGNIIYIGEVRAVVNENFQQEFGPDWLKLIESENEQRNENDPRWNVGNVIDPTTYSENQIYKVAKLEEFTRVYYIQGDLNSDKIPNKFYTDEECTELLTPEDQKVYWIKSLEQKTYGTDYYFRYSAYDKAYLYVTDTRYTYENYIWNGIEYEIRDSSHDEILTLDLTDKFDEQPKNNQKFQKKIYEETLKYVKDNKIGEIKESIKVSFIKLSSSPEYSKWKELEKVALGDTVHVIYEELGINVLKKVVKTDYNVLKESYDEIELGEKSTKFTTEAIVSGDNVSSLTNDRNFADDITVTNLFAKYIEADYIKGITAEITTAQIDTLTSDSITATLIEAERFEIDKLVASLLVADNATIRDTLTVGDGIVVSGEINIKNGSISINGRDRIATTIRAYTNPNASQEFSYDWLKANKSDTEALVPDIASTYDVYNSDTDMHIGYYQYKPAPEERYIQIADLDGDVYFEVDETGNVTANSLMITGGEINLGPDFNTTVIKAYTNLDAEEYSSTWLKEHRDDSDPLSPNEVYVYKVYDSNFQDDKLIGYYKYNISETKYETTHNTGYKFTVDEDGNVFASSIHLKNGIVEASSGTLKGIDKIETKDISITDSFYCDKITVGSSINLGSITLDDESEYSRTNESIYIYTVATIEDNETMDEDNNYINKVSFSYIASLRDSENNKPYIAVGFTDDEPSNVLNLYKYQKTESEIMDPYTSSKYYMVYNKTTGNFLGYYKYNVDDLVYNKYEDEIESKYLFPDTQLEDIIVYANNPTPGFIDPFLVLKLTLTIFFEDGSQSMILLPNPLYYASTSNRIPIDSIKISDKRIHTNYFYQKNTNKIIKVEPFPTTPNLISNYSILIYNKVITPSLKIDATSVIIDKLIANNIESDKIVSSNIQVKYNGPYYYQPLPAIIYGRYKFIKFNNPGGDYDKWMFLPINRLNIYDINDIAAVHVTQATDLTEIESENWMDPNVIVSVADADGYNKGIFVWVHGNDAEDGFNDFYVTIYIKPED